jgi:hypothetical protein
MELGDDVIPLIIVGDHCCRWSKSFNVVVDASKRCVWLGVVLLLIDEDGLNWPNVGRIWYSIIAFNPGYGLAK